MDISTRIIAKTSQIKLAQVKQVGHQGFIHCRVYVAGIAVKPFYYASASWRWTPTNK